MYQKAVRRLGRLASELRTGINERLDQREIIHFLHIGKNAGNQIKHLASLVNDASLKYRILVHRHNVTLSDIPADARYFFSIRSPVSRFKSGFYSRKRMGRPLRNSKWSEMEQRAFERFEHADEIATALFKNGSEGRDAMCAIKSIKHCANDQISWFTGQLYFLDTRPPVGIIRTESLESDFNAMLARLGGSIAFTSTSDPVLSHRNDYSKTVDLSEEAVENLKRWYGQDMEFYRHCEAWIRAQGDS